MQEIKCLIIAAAEMYERILIFIHPNSENLNIKTYITK